MYGTLIARSQDPGPHCAHIDNRFKHAEVGTLSSIIQTILSVLYHWNSYILIKISLWFIHEYQCCKKLALAQAKQRFGVSQATCHRLNQWSNSTLTHEHSSRVFVLYIMAINIFQFKLNKMTPRGPCSTFRNDFHVGGCIRIRSFF